MRALTKSDMSERLCNELGLSSREAKEIMHLFFEELVQCLERNEPAKLSGFGNFTPRDKAERPGRNPTSGQNIPISARRIVTFHSGQKLRARVGAYEGSQPDF